MSASLTGWSTHTLTQQARIVGSLYVRRYNGQRGPRVNKASIGDSQAYRTAPQISLTQKRKDQRGEKFPKTLRWEGCPSSGL